MSAAAQRTASRPKRAKKKRVASAVEAPRPAAAKPAAEPECCEFCGATLDEEALGLQAKFGRLHCPGCGREGCYECMPSGRGCICPECEEGGPQE